MLEQSSFENFVLARMVAKSLERQLDQVDDINE
jgi:hypothetical protein